MVSGREATGYRSYCALLESENLYYNYFRREENPEMNFENFIYILQVRNCFGQPDRKHARML